MNDLEEDAEGYFSITSNRNAYTFTFGIGLHIDVEVLKYIQETMQIGTVYIKPYPDQRGGGETVD